MLMNADTANKLVRQLQTDRNALLAKEREVSTYSYASGEETVVPEYDFLATHEKLNEFARKIAIVKHAVNKFNVETVLPGFDFTIDAALVRMAILSGEKEKLERMRSILPKSRTTNFRGNSEYTVRNFNEDDVQAAYQSVCDELMRIQQALNLVNMTETFEVPLD